MTAALLAKYPKIDGIISNYGTDALAAIRAFQAAGRKPRPGRNTRRERPLVPLQLDAEVGAAVPDRDDLVRNWLGRIAARKAIAAAEGLPNNEPSRYTLPFFEDTLGGKKAVCDPKAGAGLLPVEQASRPPTSASTGRSARRGDGSPRRSPPHGRRQDVPGRRRAQGRDLRGRRRRGPRARRRERRGQVDADGGGRRLDAARPRHRRDRRASARRALARRRPGGSGWRSCTSTSRSSKT